MIFGIYTRVSTGAQVRKSDSLADQDGDARAWIEANGHTAGAVYSDPGLSGKLSALERPGLLDALDALEVGIIDGLVIRDLDRLSRKLTVQEAVLERIWSQPGAVVIEYDYDREVPRDDPDDPMRAFMRQVVGAVKELDRAMVAKRLRDGRRSKARKGQHPSGPAAYGWQTTGGKLYPVPDELAVLDVMRGLRRDGLTQADVAAALNERGYPARGGGPWTQPVVSRILRRDAERTPEQRAYHDERRAARLTGSGAS